MKTYTFFSPESPVYGYIVKKDPEEDPDDHKLIIMGINIYHVTS